MMNPSRRQFCINTALAGGFAFLPSAFIGGHALAQTTVQVGAAKVMSFSDGVMRVPVTMLFRDDAPAGIKKLLEESGMGGEEATRPLNVTLAEIGGRKILFDAGSGANFLPGLGRLPSELESAGIDTDSITDVVFTHAHPDHIWGVVDDFDEVFIGDANYHISRREWEFWDSDDTLAAMPEDRKGFAVGAKARFDALRDRVNLFEFGDEIAPGVEAVASNGHTPGHTSFALHDGGDSLMVLGDALTHPLISFQFPDFPNNSDFESDDAVASRMKILDRMTADKMQLIGYHLPASGMGRAEKSGGAYRYVPL